MNQENINTISKAKDLFYILSLVVVTIILLFQFIKAINTFENLEDYKDQKELIEEETSEDEPITKEQKKLDLYLSYLNSQLEEALPPK